MKSRLERLREKLDEESLPGLFVSGIENLRYLSGFTGSAGFGLVTAERALFFADSRYHIQAEAECPEFDLVKCEQRLLAETAETIQKMNLPRMGVERNFLTLGQYQDLQEPLKEMELAATDGIVEGLRRVKEPEEIEAIRAACGIVDRAYAHILGFIREDISERDLALELDFFMRRNGASKSGFETIVAFGPHSAYPHARPGDATLERGQFVKMDFGAHRNSYNSDLTRTVVLGPTSDRHREIYEIVLEAQRRALEALKPGPEGKAVDAAARDYIAERGYGECFGHGLGHGLGREVHDGGALNKSSEIVMEPGQVWTIEPGVYVEGFGGVRIEDDAVVTETGCEVLTSAPKAFTVID